MFLIWVYNFQNWNCFIKNLKNILKSPQENKKGKIWSLVTKTVATLLYFVPHVEPLFWPGRRRWGTQSWEGNGRPLISTAQRAAESRTTQAWLPSASGANPSALHSSPVTLSIGRVYKLGTIIWGRFPFPLSKVNPSRGEKYVKFLDTSSSLVFQMLKFTQRKRSGFLSKCTLPCPKGKNFVHKSNACHT